MKKQQIIFIFIILSSLGCKMSVEKEILQQLKRDDFSKRKEHTLLMNEITNFEWEKMYIFSNWTSADSIKTAINLEYNGEGVPDSYSRIIFVNGNKIIYQEDFKSLDYNNSTISFQTLDNSTFYTGRHYLTPSSAKFNIIKTKTEGGCSDCYFYSLIILK